MYTQVYVCVCVMQYDGRVGVQLLNDADVRKALHAAPVDSDSEDAAGFYVECTTRVNYSAIVESTVPYHLDNIQRGECQP